MAVRQETSGMSSSQQDAVARSNKKKGTYNAAAAAGETPAVGITPQGQKDLAALVGDGPKGDYSAFNSQANVKALNAKNTASEKQHGPIAGDSIGGLLYGIGGMTSNPMLEAMGQYVAKNSGGTHQATAHSTPGYDPAKSEYGGGALNLDALNAKGNAAHQAAAGGGGGDGAGTWGWNPTAPPPGYKIDLGSLPTLAKTADLASFMAQAAKSSHLDQVKQPYENVIKQVGSDAATSEAQAQAMYAALQGQLSAGAGNIAGGYDASSANAAQTEAALSSQVQNTYGAGSAAADASAQALGMGGLSGQIANNSLAASQGALGDLQSNLQATQAQNEGDKNAALAANSDMGAAVGARSTQDVGNMAMAASDAKARVGVAEGQAYNQASQAAAALGGNLWSTALNNNLGAFNAEAGLWGAKTNAGLSAASQAEAAWAAQNGMSLQGAQLGETQRQFDMGYGLNEQQLLAQIMGAKSASNQQAYQDFTKLANAGQLYNGTQPGSIAAMNQAFQNMLANSPYPVPKFPNSTSLSSSGN